MKQSPQLQKIQEEMQKGGLSLEGFLGEDTRPIIDIILEDQEMVTSLGLTNEIIADGLEELSQLAMTTPKEWVPITNEFEVRAEEYRGRIACPFKHPGLFSKNHVEAKHLKLTNSIYWSDLSIHLIRKHGFYQGRGAYYRINPKDIRYILNSK